ncbi:MAG: SLC13 family permease [Cyclobacteriaceae bacterium]
MRKAIPILVGPLSFLLIMLTPPFTGMSDTAHSALASTVWIAIWWVTEAIPVPVTSLLPLVLFPLTGVMEIRQTAGPYANPLIYLFIGGFVLALAMEKWNLHRRIALTIIHMVGTNMRQLILGFILACGFLSMWISNTATTVMMLPIALSIVTQFKEFNANSDRKIPGADVFPLALILALPYSASIGGMATLVGTPTNLIFIDSVERIYNTSIPFAEWMAVGFPIAVIMLFVTWFHLTRTAFNISNEVVPGSKQIIEQELKKLGPIKYEEKWVLTIFGCVAFSWILRSYIISPFFPAVDDTIIVLIGAALLFIIPDREKQQQLMDWETALKLPWGVLILFGGAFSVAAAFAESGLTAWIGDQLSGLGSVPFWLALLIIVAVVNYLTEVTQNMATCTLMMPIMAALAGVIGVHPFPLMTATCIASSCAFMLPVATAPNAVVFGSGFIKMKDMVRAGFMLNILSILVIVFVVYFLLPAVWGIDMMSFPEEMKK